MNPFEMLRDEHRTARGLVESLSSGDDDARREELFQKLSTQLDVHAQIEEDHFYPALRDEIGADDALEDGREEHDKIRALLESMSGQSIGSEDWNESLALLRKTLDHHVKEEEDEVFPLAEAMVSRSFMREVAAAMERERSRLLS